MDNAPLEILESVIKNLKSTASTKDDHVKAEIFERALQLEMLTSGQLVKLGVSKDTSAETHADVLEYLKLMIAGVEIFMAAYVERKDDA